MRRVKLTREEQAIEDAVGRGEYVPVSKEKFKEIAENLKSTADHQQLLQYYQTKILPQQSEALERLKRLHAQHTRIALTCLEADYRSCHRYKITEYLRDNSALDARIIHL